MPGFTRISGCSHVLQLSSILIDDMTNENGISNEADKPGDGSPWL